VCVRTWSKSAALAPIIRSLDFGRPYGALGLDFLPFPGFRPGLISFAPYGSSCRYAASSLPVLTQTLKPYAYSAAFSTLVDSCPVTNHLTYGFVRSAWNVNSIAVIAAAGRLRLGRMTVQEPQPQPDGIVYVVDDDPGVRDGMSDLLQSLQIRSELFDNCEHFLDEWKDGSPSCLLLDVQMPGVTGLELQEKLATRGTQIPIIFMTAHGDVPMVRRVMKAGAVEFLTKPINVDDLIQAITTAFARDRARRQRDEIRQALQARLESLSGQQREVLRHVTDGLLNKQIAAEMNLSEITVKQYRRQVMDKMQAQSVADLAKMVAEYRGLSQRES
jgi:FixJ family two-component response regulator